MVPAQLELSVSEALQAGSGRLRRAGVESPRLDAELLMAKALGWSRTALISGGKSLVPPDALSRFEAFVERRLAHEPSALILGRREFFGLEFLLKPGVLVPRPETELLVELGLTRLAESEGPPRFAEIGVGSGCVSISLLHKLPEALACATDISDVALAVAGENARLHGVSSRLHLCHGSMLAPLPPESGLYDLIVSNPPYVRTGDLAQLPPEVRFWEPPKALDGGEDGLDAVRAILTQAPSRLAPKGRILIEIGQGQAEAAKRLAEGGPFQVEAVHPDLAAVPRVVELRWT